MKIKRLLQAITTSGFLALPYVTLAQGFGQTEPFEGTATDPLPEAIIRIVNFFLILAAIIGAVFLVIGGVRYITSQGVEEAQEQAKNTILYAVIGLIMIALSAAIVNFVVVAATG